MNNIFDKYKRIIDKDYALYVDMINAYDHNKADILHDTGHTLILRLKSFPLYLPLTDDVNEALNLLEKYDVFLMIARNKEIIDAYFKKGFDGNICYQVYYDGPKLDVKYDIIKPHKKDLKLISDSYDLGGLNEIENAYKENRFFATYDKDELAGFIGIHDEDSCGMLHVFEKYRQKGYGKALESFILNYQLDRGYIPYGHVIEDNMKSLSLQKEINMKISKGRICWMWKDE